MLAYSTTNTPEDGPVLLSSAGRWPISPLDATLSGFKGADPTAPFKASQSLNRPRR